MPAPDGSAKLNIWFEGAVCLIFLKRLSDISWMLQILIFSLSLVTILIKFSALTIKTCCTCTEIKTNPTQFNDILYNWWESVSCFSLKLRDICLSFVIDLNIVSKYTEIFDRTFHALRDKITNVHAQLCLTGARQFAKNFCNWNTPMNAFLG